MDVKRGYFYEIVHVSYSYSIWNDMLWYHLWPQILRNWNRILNVIKYIRILQETQNLKILNSMFEHVWREYTRHAKKTRYPKYI